MLKVHGIWHSAATSRVLTVLLEKEVPFTLVEVNSYAGESKQPQHLALHVISHPLSVPSRPSIPSETKDWKDFSILARPYNCYRMHSIIPSTFIVLDNPF